MKVSYLLRKYFPRTFYRLKTIKRSYYEKKIKSYDLEQRKNFIDKIYFSHINCHINWNNPKTYTEKMQIEKLFHNYPIKTKLADKIEVREWVKEIIGEEYLIPLIGMYENPNEIDFTKLPNNFVIKTNSGSGDVIVVRDKTKLNKLDFVRIKEKLKYHLSCNYALDSFEMHYAEIKPRILIEEYIDSGEESLTDYKFMCFNGKSYYCWVDKDRTKNHTRNVYDMNWILQPWTQAYNNYKGDIKCPKNFDRMIELAEILSKDFVHVRVDLYNVNGRIYFGEMTFTNGSGLKPIVPSQWDIKLGSLWTDDIFNQNY